jgi:hypothetical protein
VFAAVNCKVRRLTVAVYLRVVPSGVYKVSINPIHPIQNPSISHAHPYYMPVLNPVSSRSFFFRTILNEGQGSPNVFNIFSLFNLHQYED